MSYAGCYHSFALFTMSAMFGLLLSLVVGYACYFLQILRFTGRSESRARRQAAREMEP